MKSTPEAISLLSTLINLILSSAKFFVGFTLGSIALIAEAIHSSLDVVSSFIAYLGIKAASKPADKEHPYGHERYESIASFAVVLLLAASGIWILYEAVPVLISGGKKEVFALSGLIIMGVSAIVNEIMARIKFKSANISGSLVLTADGEHSRADVFASLAVLVGLYLTKFFSPIDSILAILVALYIIFEAYHLMKESIDSLVDKADPALEKEIEEFLQKKYIKAENIRTRKIGKYTLAEITLSFNPRFKLNEVTKDINQLEDELVSNFTRLKQVVISVKSHDIQQGLICQRFGRSYRSRQALVSKEFEKKGERTIIPLKNGQLADDFGAEEYLVIDRSSDGGIIEKQIMKNSFYEFEKSHGHGVRFAKSVDTDKIISKFIGHGAMDNLKSQGIEVIIIDKDKKLKDLEESNYETEKM